MLEEIKTFIAVVEEKSFTKAAKKRNLSQPSVSVHIKNLEKEFGIILIARSVKQKGITITSGGEVLYRRAKDMVNLLQITKNELHYASETLMGHLTIGATFTIDEYILPAFLSSYCKKYPNMEIEIVVGNTPDISRLTKEYKLDFGLVEGTVQSSHLNQRFLCEDQLMLMIPKKFGLVDKESCIEKLQNRNWITRQKYSELRGYQELFLKEKGIHTNRRLILGSDFAIKEAIKSGLGIAMVSYYMANTIKETEDIEIVSLGKKYKRQFTIIDLKKIDHSKNAKIFEEELLTFYNK